MTPKKTIQIQTKWDLVKLGEFVKLIESGNRPKGGVGNIDDGVWSLGGEHIHASKGTVDLSKPKYVPIEFFKKTKRGKLQENDVLICKDGALTGKVALLRKELEHTQGMINEHVFLLRCHNLSSQKYLFNFLFSSQGQNLLKLNITGAAQGGLNSTNLKNIKIPLPPLKVQNQIVEECETIDKETQKAEETVQKLRAEIEEKVQQVYENITQIKKLSELALINPSKREIRNLDENTLISFVEMASVSDEGFIAKKVNKKYAELKKGSYTYFAENDIIIAKITPCMENGKCAIAKELTNKIALGSSEFHVIRTNQGILNQYVFALLNRKNIRKEAEQNMTGSSGHRRVPASFYENYKIPVPSLSEQKKLVAKLEKIENQIAQNQEIIAKASTRKQAVMKKYL